MSTARKLALGAVFPSIFLAAGAFAQPGDLYGYCKQTDDVKDVTYVSDIIQKPNSVSEDTVKKAFGSVAEAHGISAVSKEIFGSAPTCYFDSDRDAVSSWIDQVISDFGHEDTIIRISNSEISW